MKRLLLLLSILALLLLTLQVVRASPDAPFAIYWWTVDGGGGISSGGAYTLTGTVGQAETGSAQSGDYAHSGGFWARLLDAWQELFLAYVTK